MADRSTSLQVHLPCAAPLTARATWALEALMARAGVPDWVLTDDPDAADLVLPHDPAQWSFAWDAEPDAQLDPLAATFWWLARVEELLAPETAFDEAGRFRYASSALARGGQPLATPVDDCAARLPIDASFRGEPKAGAAAWSIVPTHDIDLSWRWTRRGVRRAAKDVVRALRGGRFGAATMTALALAAVPYWRVRRDDPWCNAQRIRRLEWGLGARSTSYVLTEHHAPQDGDAEMHARGRDRYVARLVEGTTRRRTAGGGAIGLHGSYTTSVTPGAIARERRALERLVGGDVRDHRYHYLRHRPVLAWPELAAAGITSDATLGYAEQPGFRAGTAHPYRAWDHERGAALALVVIPLAFMDASLDARYLDLEPTGAGGELARQVLDTVARVGGCASILFHNDRLCTVDRRPWTRLYRQLLSRVRDGGGSAGTAREAAIAYRTSLPAWRLEA